MKAAVFDLDRTLTSTHSARSWFDHERARGRASYGAAWVAVSRHGATVEALEFMARRGYRGVDERALADDGRAFAEATVLPRLRPWALAEIEAHRAAGRRAAVASAHLSAVVDPVCEALGLERAAATVLEPAASLSGRVQCHGYAEGKLVQVRAWATGLGIALSDVAFYTDSITDMPLLEAVGQPIAVTPDPKLRVVAKARGWRIVEEVEADCISPLTV